MTKDAQYLWRFASKLFEMELTKRETQVLERILEGKSNLEISEELFVSINTIKTHVAHILRKENVKNRIQLISKQISIQNK